MKDLAASVQARLRNEARAAGEDFQLVLTRYGIERFLYRLVAAGYGDRFVLKGAQLLFFHLKERFRPTRDVDLMAYEMSTPEELTHIFQEIGTVSVEPDGLEFDAATVQADPIRTHDEHGGVRVKLRAALGRARIPLQIDVGFGDAITPAPQRIEYPTLLDAPAPTVLAYPLATVIAEKMNSLAALGLATSRMKDIYDLWRITTTLEVDKDDVETALRRTFERRGTEISGIPVVLTEVFWRDENKQVQWTAFLKRSGLTGPELREACAVLADAVAKYFE